MKIALCGSAPSSKGLAPYRDESWTAFTKAATVSTLPTFEGEEWEIWGCSPGLFGTAERTTRWFELHRWEPGAQWFSPEYCQWLREYRGTVYTGRPIPEIKNHEVYPIAEAEALFSPYFFTSSLALMMAKAIMEIEHARTVPGHDPEEDTIGLWGVDMSATEEFQYQKPGCHFFILEALRRGIGVYVPPESCLMRPMPVYGICEWDSVYVKMTARAREFSRRTQEAKEQMVTADRNFNIMGGAMDDLNYMVNTWTSPYGLPSGITIRHAPGEGLGSGITHIDGISVR